MNSAVVLFLLLALAAACLCVGGVYVLFGPGCAMLAAAGCLGGAALLVRRGLTANG